MTHDADAALRQLVAALAPPPTEVAGLEAAIVAHMPAVVLLLDPEGRILWTNRPAAGPARDAVLGRSMFDYIPAADQEDARAALARVNASGQPDRYVGYGPGRRGPRSRYESWLSPVVAEGAVRALVLATRDVSEEWEVYEALRDREQRLSLVLRAAGMGMWRFDMRTRTVEFDDHARAVYGVDAARLDSLTFTTTYIHPDDRADADARALASVASRRPYVAQNRVLRSDGALRWVEVTGSPVLDERGELLGLMGTVTDITERRELEERARQAQRLDAVGQLTAGIAHNFNNLLAAILPTLAMVEHEVPPSSRELVRGAMTASERAAELVRQLMTLAGRNRGQERVVEAPGAIVERTVGLCRFTFDRRIALTMDIERDLPALRVDVGLIEQAVLNLLLNARDAVTEAGRADPRVVVRVRAVVGNAGARGVAVEVADNGPGVPIAHRDRIFDPFFTTKPIGRGTGLGLSTAYAIAREHEGSLLCGEEPGGGARFTLLLPAVDAAPDTPTATPRRPPLRQGTVLVVDDEDLVRRIVVSSLRGQGFTVFDADGATRAAAVLAEGHGVGVVLLDLNMPGTPWRDLVAAIRRDHPGVKVVAFTGGTTAPEGDLDGWLAKPAPVEAIADAITRVMSGRGAPSKAAAPPPVPRSG